MHKGIIIMLLKNFSIKSSRILLYKGKIVANPHVLLTIKNVAVQMASYIFNQFDNPVIYYT